MEYLPTTVSAAFLLVVLLHPRVRRFRGFLERLFWIDRMRKSQWTPRAMMFMAWCSLGFYVFAVPFLLIGGALEGESLWGASFPVIAFPLVYRFSMWMQLAIHGIR